MTSSQNDSDTKHLPTEHDFCRTAATSAFLYDHSYITRFSIPKINSRNTRITAHRYSQLQQDIKRNVESNINGNQMNIDPHPTLTELKRDVEKAFKDTTNGILYPVSNSIHTLNIESHHQQAARFKTNTINTNNPQSTSLQTIQQILSLPRSKVMGSSQSIIMKEEKTMDIDDDICVKPTYQKMTPLKRKLTEVIDDDDDDSPYRTPKAVKRRKLTHRRGSSISIIQSPFLHKSMSLSQRSVDLENHEPNNYETDSIQTVQSHLNTFCARFKECVEDIPLGHINMERATECEQMSWMTVRFSIESLAKCHEIQSLQVKTLKPLLSLIEKQLCCSMESELIHPPNIPFQADIDNVAKSIQAAIIALYIMVAKDIHRSLIQDDILCKIMRMITFHIANNFTPCKDEQQRAEYKQYFNDISPKKGKKTNKKRRKKSKKKQREQTEQEEIFWRDINTQMNTLYADFCSSLLLLMNIYIEKEVVREQQMVQLLNCCFTTFDKQNMDDIQDGCKAIIVTIFVKYESHRDDILNGIMDYYRNTERTYFAKRKIADESKDKDTNYIHLINMLILEICQCLANKMLLSFGTELRQIQLMNTPHANHQRVKRRFHLRNKPQKEITEGTKHELFTKCIMQPMEDCKRTLNDIIKGIVNMVMDTKHKGARLVMFYKDLENVWDLIEWPIAEYALTVTLGAFRSYLTSKHIDNNKQFKAFRPYFIAGLASICATARSAKKMGTKNKIHCTSKTELNEKQSASLSSANPLDESERIDCKCGSNKKSTHLNRMLMIDCDDCHSWSHGQCVGIESKEDIPQHWICDFCQINREIERQLVAINARHANDDQVYDESTKLHILLINYLSKQLPMDLCHTAAESWYISQASSHELSARQFHVIQWLYWRLKSTQKNENESADVNDTYNKHLLRLFSDYFIMPNQAQLKILPTFSDFGIHRVNMQLALERRLITFHDTMIYFITSDLHHAASKTRTKALKSLKEICDVDATILKEQNISDRVIEKFKDKSAAVREAAVDLVGNFVIYEDCDASDSSLISVYFKDLKLRIIDNAVSVRKRVIRIFREICLKSPSNPKYSEICLCLFSKMSERNEGIKKLVANTFEEMWFSDTQILRNRVCTKNHKGGFKTFSHAFIQLVEQIIDSISSSNDDEEIYEYLIDLILKMLEKEEKKTSKAQHKSDVDKNRVFGICHDMVCVIIDKLKQCNYDWCAVKPLMDSLYIFSKVRPLFVTPHFVTLTSFMTTPPKSNGPKYKTAVNVIKTLAQILTTIIPFIDRSQITKTSQKQLQTQMIRILWNAELSLDLIYDGVYCDIVQSLCYLVQHLSKDYKFIIQNIFELPIGALSARQNDAKWSKTKQKVNKFQVIRSLLFLGFATKYFDVNQYVNDDDNINLDKIYEIYLFFLQNTDSAFDIFHQYAIQGFIPLFCRKPALMIREQTTNIIRQYLNENEVVHMSEKTEFLQTECLNALHQFFETEERRTQLLQTQSEHKQRVMNVNNDDDDIESDEELSDAMHDEEEQEKKDSTGINGDIAGIRSESTHDRSDYGDLIHFINTISPSITKLCSSSSSSVRNHCCQILLDWTTSLCSNPLEYLRQIIALSLDATNEKTRNMALIAFYKIIQRTPSLFNMNFINGIIQYFKLTHFSLNATFIDYHHSDAHKKVNKQIIEHVFVQNIHKLFGVLDEMNKTKQQQIISSVTRSIISYMDFDACCKKKIVKRQNYLIIPMFITFLCHFLCSVPFETYKASEAYAVIQSLDHLLKNNMSKTKENMTQTKQAIEQIDIGTNNELLLQHSRNLYQYSCRALLCLIIYQFRSFWCKLYNLSDQNISVYKLTANKKKVEKEKNFKAKKISNIEQQMFFEFNFKNSTKKMMTQMNKLYQCFFVENEIKENHVASNKNGKRKRHNTRSRQKQLEKESKCTIASVLIEINDEFTQIVSQFLMEDLERYTQSDEDIHFTEVEDEESEDTNINTKTKQKKKQKKKPKAKPKQNRKRGKKKKQIYSEEEEEEKADEDTIIYADTSSDDNANDTSDAEF